jgi:opacity protein-like surface antigen
MFSAYLCCLAALLQTSCVQGADASNTVASAQNAIANAEIEDFSYVFRKGAYRVGFSVGAGPGFAMCGSTEGHDLALCSVGLGFMPMDTVGSDMWYRGNWELIGELFGGAQFDPVARYVAGVTPLLRYNFATGTRWRPFLTAGAGVCLTDISHPDLSGALQFNPQAGFGTHYFLNRRTALTVEYRWLHISNSGLAQPNHGVNTQMFTAGVAWFF